MNVATNCADNVMPNSFALRFLGQITKENLLAYTCSYMINDCVLYYKLLAAHLQLESGTDVTVHVV